MHLWSAFLSLLYGGYLAIRQETGQFRKNLPRLSKNMQGRMNLQTSLEQNAIFFYKKCSEMLHTNPFVCTETHSYDSTCSVLTLGKELAWRFPWCRKPLQGRPCSLPLCHFPAWYCKFQQGRGTVCFSVYLSKKKKKMRKPS